MPTYQYECDSCGHTFEILQSMTEDRLKSCPACRKKSLVRLIGTGSGIIFKGSGFYETDYKRKSPAKEEASKDQGKKEPTTSESCPPSSSGCCPNASSCPHAS